MTRVVIIGGDASSVQLLAAVLAHRDIQVLDAQAFEQEERARQNLFELQCYDRVELRLPEIFLAQPSQPAHAYMRDLRQQSRHVQSAKQQSLRAKARR